MSFINWGLALPHSVVYVRTSNSLNGVDVVDAKLNLLWLKRKKVITEDLMTKIENSNHANTKKILFDHLMRNADVAGLRMYCKMAIDVDDHPNMYKLERNMLDDLATEDVCVCVCVCVLTRATSPLHVCLHTVCCCHQNCVRMYVHLSPLFGQSTTRPLYSTTHELSLSCSLANTSKHLT